MAPLVLLDGNIFSISGAGAFGRLRLEQTELLPFISVYADCTDANTAVPHTSVDGSEEWKVS